MLGHAIVASALLAVDAQAQGTLTLQVQSQGPLELLVVQCTQALALRGVAKAKPAAAVRSPIPQLADGGHLAVTIEASETERYQGIVPLARAASAACLEEYFHRLEQLATRLWLAADNERAAGPAVAAVCREATTRSRKKTGRACRRSASTLDAPELLPGRPAETLLARVFPRASPCACSGQRRRTSIARARARASRPSAAHAGRRGVRALLAEQGTVSVACEFCGKRYSF